MLLCVGRRGFHNHEILRPSYVEISRFIRDVNALSAPRRSNGQSSSRGHTLSRRLHYSHRSFQDVPSKSPEANLFDTYKSSLSFSSATHEILNLERPDFPRQEVVLHGYLGSRTDLSKNLYFVPLLSKDLSHSIQIVSSAKSIGGREHLAHKKLRSLDSNTPVVVRGLLKVREPAASKDLGDIKKIKTQEVELWDVQPLNEFPKDIIITPETVFSPEYRHLQIRQDKKLRDALAFRSKTAAICRDILSKDFGFTEIETPVLFKSTPEGAREFIVPTRRRGMAYALPQSPQQFKQILMASGISKYYQLAKCFRDEDRRADRQPEFTQLDLEMSFASGKDVMECIETLVRRLWNDMLDIKLPSPFLRMTYHQAMSTFGSDKPDIRVGMPIHRIGHLLPAGLIRMVTSLADPVLEVMLFQLGANDSNPGTTRKFVNDFLDSPEGSQFNDNIDGGPGIFVYNTKQPMQGLGPFGFEAAEEIERLLDPEPGDLIVLQARKNEDFHGGSTMIGNLRLALHRAAVAQGLIPAPQGFEPLWITDFPLFSPSSASEPGQGGAAGLASTHHPFTSPKSAEDVDLLLSDPSKVTGEHYDLVMNGVELGGGSRRVHNAAMQRYIMEEVLKMTPERVQEFSHLLEALRAGCPPHAGIALGFDRLIAVMLGRDSVRDVIAFPKSGKGEDMLVKSPSEMSEDVLKTYHLRLREEE
ncbi:aspartyl-tRNA synthetase 2, mitochondrial [Xylographa parallela]|nr:aspartyl-tRNA synthetase 2, mitochondrial [Xylographa parallela]